MYLLSVCCRKQMLSLLLTKAALLLDLVKEEMGSFLPFLYFRSRCLFSDLFFKSQSLPLCFFPSPAPPAFAGLTNTFISSHKNWTNIELTTMMLDQRKGLVLQPGTRTSRHALLVSLRYPLGPGLCFSPGLKSSLNRKLRESAQEIERRSAKYYFYIAQPSSSFVLSM